MSDFYEAIEEIMATIPEGMVDAQDALDRMRRASKRGTGCYLTADMVSGLGTTIIGEMWEESRPPVQPST